MKKKFIESAILIVTSFLLSGCSAFIPDTYEYSKDVYAMDTYMTITAYGKNAKEAVEDSVEEINYLESIFSAENADSEIYKLNEEGFVALSEDSLAVITKAKELWQETGTFDIAIYPVMELWGFTGTRDNMHVPDDESLKEALEHIDPENIEIDSESGKVTFADSLMKIDLGGIAKGYTSSKIMEIFKEDGVKSGIVSLGGNVQVFGKKVNGDDWKVAIENPNDTESYLGVLSVSDGLAVITSGGYQRNFTENGKTYHHIIDPATGYPADNGLVSVTIISSDGTLADGLSTALYIMGKENAISFYQSGRYDFEMILMDDTGMVFASEGVADNFSSELEYEIIHR